MSGKLTLLPHGPIKVEGDFELFDGAGHAFGTGGRPAVFLCRCGRSNNKPLCDGSHASGGFRDDCSARPLR